MPPAKAASFLAMKSLVNLSKLSTVLFAQVGFVIRSPPSLVDPVPELLSEPSGFLPSLSSIASNSRCCLSSIA